MPFNIFGQPVERSALSTGGRSKNKMVVLGCEQCPSDRVPGINKILGLKRVTGRRAMLWAMCPGANENEAKLELVGKSGKLLWDTLAHESIGLKREDFDIQNVMRCWNVDRKRNEWEPKSPEFKRALQCCGPFNTEALERNRGRAVVHLILGDVAGQKLLGKAFRKDVPIFWHEPFKAYVVLNWHPSFILRQGGVSAGWNYNEWRQRMRAVVAILKHPGKLGYVRGQDYAAVRTLAQLDALERTIRAEAKAGRRVSVDIEDGVVDGKRVILMVGFGWGHYKTKAADWQSWTGGARSVIIDHPEANLSPSIRKEIIRRVATLLDDPTIRKCLQHGNYDCSTLQQILHMRVRGYDYDTQYGTFLKYSFMRSLGLEEQVLRFLPEFCEYKHMVDEYHPNLANAPLDLLVTYNCADCDATKRLEERFSPQVNNALVQVYANCAFTLDDMETRGPFLDWEHLAEIEKRLPGEIEKLDRALQHVSGDPEFNTGSQKVEILLYDTLGFPDITGERARDQPMKRGTDKEVLERLAAQTGSPVPEMIKRRRALGVVQSTYCVGYAASARQHNGQVRTVWKLTGAVTGRLRSGKGEKAEAQGVVNLQNIHGNPLLQNMLVSDPAWRKAL